MDNDNDILIQKYFDGLLSELEEADLLNRLESDSELKTEFDTYQQLYTHLDTRAHINESRQIIKNKEAPIQAPKTAKRMFLRIIALAILGLLAFYFLKSNEKVLTNEQLYIAYFEAEPIHTETKNNPAKDAIQTGLKYYNQGKYIESTSTLSPLIDSLINHEKLALAISYMKLERYVEAQSILNDLEKIDVFSNAAKWYTALIHLDKERIDECIQLLSRIDQKSSYFRKAKELSNRLHKQ